MELSVFEEAGEVLERLVEHDPRSARGFGQLGMCRAGPSEGRLEAAEAAFRQAASINREETGPHLRLAEVALRRNDDRAAIRALETVLKSNPASEPAHVLTGYLEPQAR